MKYHHATLHDPESRSGTAADLIQLAASQSAAVCHCGIMRLGSTLLRYKPSLSSAHDAFFSRDILPASCGRGHYPVLR